VRPAGENRAGFFAARARQVKTNGAFMFDDDDTGQREGAAGRPAGRQTQQQLGECFLDALLEDWRAHGKRTIAQVRDDKPEQYLRLVAAVLPREFDVQRGVFDDLTDEEVNAVLAYVKNALGLGPAAAAGARPPEH
jgi:hypothetical protein